MVNKPIDVEDLGDRLKRLRKARGFTLQTVAAATGVSKSTISEMESGVRKGVMIETVRKIAEHYGMPVEKLWNNAPSKQQSLDNLAPAVQKALLGLIKAIEDDQRALLSMQAGKPSLPARPAVKASKPIILPKKEVKVKRTKPQSKRAQASESPTSISKVLS